MAPACQDLYPETLIAGQWTETEWQYESDLVHAFFEYEMDNVIKHRAETWRFDPEHHKVYFFKNDILIDSALYRFKGRGHVLKLIHNDGIEELFDVKELNQKELILHYNIGMETKGVAKLTFSRVERES